MMSNKKQSHNKEHYVIRIANSILNHGHHKILVKIGRFQREICARCLGKWYGLTHGILLIIIIYLFFPKILAVYPLYYYLISWFLAAPAIIDWLSIKVKIRCGSNLIRFLSGWSLGIGMVIYLSIPGSYIINLITLFILTVLIGSIGKIFEIFADKKEDGISFY